MVKVVSFLLVASTYSSAFPLPFVCCSPPLLSSLKVVVIYPSPLPHRLHLLVRLRRDTILSLSLSLTSLLLAVVVIDEIGVSDRETFVLLLGSCRSALGCVWWPICLNFQVRGLDFIQQVGWRNTKLSGGVRGNRQGKKGGCRLYYDVLISTRLCRLLGFFSKRNKKNLHISEFSQVTPPVILMRKNQKGEKGVHNLRTKT